MRSCLVAFARMPGHLRANAFELDAADLIFFIAIVASDLGRLAFGDHLVEIDGRQKLKHVADSFLRTATLKAHPPFIADELEVARSPDALGERPRRGLAARQN